MKKCPHCGAQLAASLVDAIVNPSREESCPKAPRVAAEPKRDTYVPSLAALMLLGRLSDALAVTA